MNLTKNDPIWHIAGIGALGSLLASRFCHNGRIVKLILKNPDQLAAYEKNPLTVISEQSLVSCHPEAIDIDHLGSEPIHYLICCVKAYDTTTLLMRLKSNLTQDSIIILIHNGLGVLDEIKTHLPQLRIIAGISTIGAYLEKPYTARAFLEGKLHLGSAIGKFTTNEMKMMCTTLETAQLPVQWEDNIHSIMWDKFAVNCSVNILTALFTCKNGELLTQVELLKKMTLEVTQVLSAYGMNMSADELYNKVTRVIRITADNYSSMYNDVQRNKPTELPYLNEYLVKLAQQKKVATPFNIELLNQFYTNFPRERFKS